MMKKLLTLLLLIPFTALSQQAYYSDVDLTLEGAALMEELSDKITVTHTNMLSYTPGVWEASKITDEDPDNPDNVLLIYGYDDTDSDYVNDRSRDKDLNGGDAGTEWNREHVYAKSLGTPSFDNEGPGADAHHLRPSDVTMNSIRGNRLFADGSGHAQTVGAYFYPGDEWKGDVARMIMYMYLRYGDQTLPINVASGTPNDIDPNMVNLLLEWNAEDPVSAVEDQRNAYHDSDATYAQGNRNPFIDNPFLATRIWGGPVAEDRWNNSDDTEAPSAPANLTASNTTETTVDLTWDPSTDNVGINGYSVYVNGEFYNSTTSTSMTLTELTPETVYDIYVIATDAGGNTSAESNTVQITTLEGANYLINEDFNDCATVSFEAYSQTSSVNWECQEQYGVDNSGSFGMNAYDGGTVESIDWLITTNPVNFDAAENEELSFYTDAAYGDAVLELLYSTDYDGTGNAEDFTWTAVPNVTIPTHPDASGNEEVFTFENVDISSISGDNVYFAFRYNTDGGDATRWTVDNFQITTSTEMGIGNVNHLDFTVYPNPSSNGSFNIAVPNTSKVEVSVYSITGKVIFSREANVLDGETRIDNLRSGFYLLKISSEGKTATKKIIIE